MKVRGRSYPFALLGLPLVFFARFGGASFSEAPMGGRAAGLEEAVVAAPGDVFSLYYNPAGLSDLAQPEAGLYYGRLFKGVTDGSNISRSFFGFASPTRVGTLGVSYSGFGMGSLYSEEIVSLGYAHPLGASFRWGGVLNYLKKSVGHDGNTDSAVDPFAGVSYGTEDPAYSNGRSASAWDGNLGISWVPNGLWRVGVMGANLMESDVGIASTDRVPRVWKAAGSYFSKIGLSLLEVSRRRVGNEMQTRIHGAIEKPFGRFALRAGAGVGPDDYSRVAAGFSGTFQAFQLDYGFLFPLAGVKETSGSHQLSLIMRFGREDSDE